MSEEPVLPFIFAELSGPQPKSTLDANFAFLLGLFTGLNAAAIPYADTGGLGVNNVQDAITKLYALIGGAGGSAGTLDFSNPDDSGLVGH